MTEEDKKEIHDCFSRWLSSDAFTTAVQLIIKRHETEKSIERNEQWLQRWPFFFTGLASGVVIGILLAQAAHH